ncbi:MAG: hypothetical protein HZB51_12030 [Chloroflexi bacterium]|nr:hypothetical protein [Chloroflexota bacterium]
MSILKLALDDEQHEFEANLKYLRAHTTQQLFDKMIQRSNEIKEMLIRDGHREPFAIIKRPSRPVRRNRSKRLSRARVRQNHTCWNPFEHSPLCMR